MYYMLEENTEKNYYARFDIAICYSDKHFTNSSPEN